MAGDDPNFSPEETQKKPKQTGIIYLITNNVNGKKYVGQTIQPVARRWNGHRFDTRTASRASSRIPLHCAMRKYGVENFSVRVVATVRAESAHGFLNILECLFIQSYCSLAPYGYNLDAGGKGKATHPDTIARMRVAAVKRMTPETRAKVGARHRGTKHSDEHRAKISASLMGNQRTLGFKPTAETRAKLSAASKNLSAEGRARISKALMGNQHAKGAVRSDEFKANVSEFHKRRQRHDTN